MRSGAGPAPLDGLGALPHQRLCDLMMDEVERVRQAYGPAKYQRLTALKRQYDPDNFFRLNQNIPPG